MSYVEYNVVETQEKAFNEFLKQTKSSVATMVNTFERKKNAFNTKNATRKKTGSLDMRRVANYRTSENIFAKKMISPNQKNHKIMILIDWSGSISSIIQPIIYQAINVAQFCKKAGIKFQVMAFVDNDLAKSRNNEGKTKVSSNEMDLANTHLLIEFLSDKMSLKEFSEGCKNLFLLGDRHIRQHTENYGDSALFALNGTPLNKALVTAREMISEDRSSFDSYSLVVLTDGESADINSVGSQYRYSWDVPDYIDPKTNKMISGSKAGVTDECGRFEAVRETGFILGLIKQLKVKNFVFHFFGHKAESKFTSRASRNVDKKVYFLGGNYIPNVDEFFYVNSSALFNIEEEAVLASSSEDEEIDWDSIDEDDDFDYEGAFNKFEKDASVSSIQKEFTKVLSSEKIKRLVGSTLVTEICSAYN